MKKMRVAAVALTAASSLILMAPPASAHALDGKDPYTTGCDNSKTSRFSGQLKNGAGDSLGTIRLYYSTYCKTNWTEIWVASTGTGTILVFTSAKTVSYAYSAGNGGHHWGNMLYAPGVCTWGKASVRLGNGSLLNGAGTVGPACG